MRTLWIVQSYVPAYRQPFFTGLRDRLRADDIEVKVLASPTDPSGSGRGDAVTADWLVPARQRTLPLGQRRLVVSSTARYWKESDGVIVPLEGSNLSTISAVLRRREHGLRVGLWGHVKNYVSAPNPIDLRIELWQMRRADHVFAYTDDGREHAVALGIQPDKVTSVRNTVDVGALLRARRELSVAEIDQFRLSTGIGDHPTVCFVGALDRSKRIDFLATALDSLWRRSPDVKVLVGGEGVQANLLASGLARGQVVILGRVADKEKAMMAAVSSAFVCPGRVGLVAVEAGVLGVPLITTRWPFHAPEIAYLTEGRQLLYANDDPDAFADEIIRVARSHRSREWDTPPVMADMIERFAGAAAVMLRR